MSNFWKNKKVVVTGGAGFLGTNVVKELIKKGVDKENIIIPRSKDCDLRDYDKALEIVKGSDVVIHLAGNVGGIGYNREKPGSLFYDNIMMGINVVQASKETKVKKLVIVGTICSYPKFTPIPFKEESLWDGYPEETNAPYGLAKKMLLVMGEGYKKEYGLNSVYLLPVNLYGPGDNFDPKSSHVIPALIKKFVDAKKKGSKTVTVWGTGKPTREFLYVKDAAKGIVMAAEKLKSLEPVNLGSSFEISIRNLADTIKEETGFKGEIVWDKSKPDGQPRRKLNVSKAEELFGFKSSTTFKKGLKETIAWYLKNR